jgi:hypothetical protein
MTKHEEPCGCLECRPQMWMSERRIFNDSLKGNGLAARFIRSVRRGAKKGLKFASRYSTDKPLVNK